MGRGVPDVEPRLNEAPLRLRVESRITKAVVHTRRFATVVNFASAGAAAESTLYDYPR